MLHNTILTSPLGIFFLKINVKSNNITLNQRLHIRNPIRCPTFSTIMREESGQQDKKITFSLIDLEINCISISSQVVAKDMIRFSTLWLGMRSFTHICFSFRLQYGSFLYGFFIFIDLRLCLL